MQLFLNTSHFLASILVVCFCAFAQSSQADTIKVLTSGAFKQVVVEIAPMFEAQTGHAVRIENDTAGALTRRVEAGESFDVLILPPSALKSLGEKNFIDGTTLTPLAKVGIGVAVKSGNPKPALSTVADFKQALQQAHRVAYIDPKAGGSSGIYLEQWFTQQGLLEMIRPKAVLVPGGLVATRLVTDEADLAIHQISEILPVSGVDLVGPLPDVIQHYTIYAVAVGQRTAHAELARSFAAMFGQPEAQTIIRKKGMIPFTP